MVKLPPCSQYTPKHIEMISKLGLRYCRKARVGKAKSPPKPKAAPKPKPGVTKPPPCSQYPGPHTLMTSKFGVKYCRKDRVPNRNKPGPSRPKAQPQVQPRRAKRPAPPKLSPSQIKNQQNVAYLRRLLANVPVHRANRIGRMLHAKASHAGAFKTAPNFVVSKNNKFLPKNSIEQARATRLEAIKAARMLRRRLGMQSLNQ